jgi:very-short-patch-repair endonuclease
VNHWIVLDDREVQADFLWPDGKLIAEVDGGSSHDTPTAFQEDRRRDQALMAAGYRVVRFPWSQVLHAPDEVTAILAKLHLT